MPRFRAVVPITETTTRRVEIEFEANSATEAPAVAAAIVRRDPASYVARVNDTDSRRFYLGDVDNVTKLDT